ncbi:hypothetical protein FCULG_00000767, partial [Fusarium culmorum]
SVYDPLMTLINRFAKLYFEIYPSTPVHMQQARGCLHRLAAMPPSRSVRASSCAAACERLGPLLGLGLPVFVWRNGTDYQFTASASVSVWPKHTFGIPTLAYSAQSLIFQRADKEVEGNLSTAAPRQLKNKKSDGRYRHVSGFKLGHWTTTAPAWP